MFIFVYCLSTGFAAALAVLYCMSLFWILEDICCDVNILVNSTAILCRVYESKILRQSKSLENEKHPETTQYNHAAKQKKK